MNDYDTNTKKSFSDKWSNNQDLAFENTLKENSEIQNWILNRNGWKNITELKDFLKTKKRILDAGCGNGRVTKLLRLNSELETEVCGIDLVAHKVASKNLQDDKNVFFYEKDLLEDLRDIGEFDFIYSQEVLHHTKNPKKAFNNLVEILSKGGYWLFMFIRKKLQLESLQMTISEKKLKIMIMKKLWMSIKKLQNLVRFLVN